MYSKNITKLSKESGFYHLHIKAPDGKKLFNTSTQKAVVVAAMQDVLHPASTEVDLVAYLLADNAIDLLFHGERHTAEVSGQAILLQYVEDINTHRYMDEIPFDSAFTTALLASASDALVLTRQLHTSQPQWRDDRYSSIGFYLDDRRGHWMQPWHLTTLYGNDPDKYLRFLQSDEPISSLVNA